MNRRSYVFCELRVVSIGLEPNTLNSSYKLKAMEQTKNGHITHESLLDSPQNGGGG